MNYISIPERIIIKEFLEIFTGFLDKNFSGLFPGDEFYAGFIIRPGYIGSIRKYVSYPDNIIFGNILIQENLDFNIFPDQVDQAGVPEK